MDVLISVVETLAPIARTVGFGRVVTSMADENNRQRVEDIFARLQDMPVDEIPDDVDSLFVEFDAAVADLSGDGAAGAAAEQSSSAGTVDHRRSADDQVSAPVQPRTPWIDRDAVDIHAAIGDGREDLGNEAGTPMHIPSFTDATAQSAHAQDEETADDEVVEHPPIPTPPPAPAAPPVAPATASSGPQWSSDLDALWSAADPNRVVGRDEEFGDEYTAPDADDADRGEQFDVAAGVDGEHSQSAPEPDTEATPLPPTPAVVDDPRRPARPAAAAEQVDPTAGGEEEQAATSPSTESAAAAGDGGVRERVTALAGQGWRRFRGLPGKYQALGWAVVGLVVVLAVVAIFGGGGQGQPSSTTSASDTGTTAAPTAQTPESVAAAQESGVLTPQSVTADCPSGSTQPQLVLSQDKSDAWVCKRANGLDLTTLTITFRRPVVVDEATFVPGFNYVEASGIDQWTLHRHVIRVLWRINDDQLVQNINPMRTGATMKFSSGATQQLSLTVQETALPDADNSSSGGAVLPGLGGTNSKADDSFALSHLKFTGHEA